MRSPLPAVIAATAVLATGCAGGPAPLAPVPPAAAAALAEARELRRGGAGAEDEPLVAALERARALAPDWVAPRRLADDLERDALRGVAALERRRQELAAAPRDAGLQYLVGRLESTAGARRFERAARLEPRLSWAWHGLAWAAAARGDPAGAARREARAAGLARDPWERAFFTASRAAQLERAGRGDGALDALRAALAAPGLQRGDRAWLALETALFELRRDEPEERERGFRRGVELLRRPDLSEALVQRAFGALSAATEEGEGRAWDLELSLAAARTPLRLELRAEGMLVEADSRLALALLEGAPDGSPERSRALARRLGRARELGLGHPRGAVEAWLAELPRQVLAAGGLPADERLRRIVLAARAPGVDESAPEALATLGAAMIEAGWFAEARALAEILAGADLERALALRERALAGLQVLAGLRRAVLGFERGGDATSVLGEGLLSSSEPEVAESPGARRPSTGQRRAASGLELLLERMGPLFARAHEWLGGEADPVRVTDELLASPRLRFGPFATLVHPGERLSAADQGAGLGASGQPVGGFAREMAALGRFGLVGEVLGGGGPDATILRRLRVERRAGRHLGVAWSGTVAWCEGVDLLGRTARAGARVSGAALHEGYWIDVASVRRDHDGWERLAREFGQLGELGERGAGGGGEEAARIELALATRGLSLREGDESARSRERRATVPLLGEADRVRLAVMRDRARLAGARAPLAVVELEELLAAVACHEEGHLVDRALFLPLGRNLGRALRLLLEGGFSPAAIQGRLEYRAHLVALCVADDPRLPLVDVLQAAETQDDGPLPHAGAYRELLADLLALLEAGVMRGDEEWRTLDPERTLAHQLHQLAPEALRALALELAAREHVGAL